MNEARKWFLTAAKQNNPQAMHNLGAMLEDTNPAEALEWYRKAVENGDDPYFFYLLYNNERMGLKHDDPEAIKYLIQDAENRGYWGQMDLAQRYETGNGVEKNIEKAVFWTWLATMGGMTAIWKPGDAEEKYPSVQGTNEKAAARILSMQLTPEQVSGVEKLMMSWNAKYSSIKLPPNVERAAKGSAVDLQELKTKALQNDKSSAYYLGNIYAYGTDAIPQNRMEAYFWYGLYAPRDVPNPGHSYWLMKVLPPEQRAAVDKRIDEWQQSHKK